LTSCIGPLKLIGVFARLSWSDLRGDRCAIFSPDSTFKRNKSVPRSRVLGGEARQTHATNFFVLSAVFSVFYCAGVEVFRADSLLTRAKIRKKTKQESLNRRTYTNKKKSFSSLAPEKARTLFILSSWPLRQP
jgi:hypothetical protein